MKRFLLKKFSPFYFIALIISIIILFSINNGCSDSTHISKEVCDIGNLVCEVSQNLCQTLPVPEQVCYYVNIACINLQLLCSNPPESKEYIEATNNLRKVNQELNKYIRALRDTETPGDTLQ